MTLLQLKHAVKTELEGRPLTNPSIRLGALEHVVDFIEASGTAYLSGGNLRLPSDKNKLKSDYEHYKGKSITGAESSIINEIYNQYER